MIKCQNHHLVMGIRWNSYMNLFMGMSWEYPHLFIPGDLHHIQTLIMSQMPDFASSQYSVDKISICRFLRYSQIFPSQSQFQLPRSFRSWRWCSVSWTLKTSQVFRVARSYWWSRWGSGASRGRRREAVEDFGWRFSGKNCLILILTLVLYPKQCGHSWGSYGRSQ